MAHHAVSCTLAILDQCENYYRVFSFPTHSQSGISHRYRMQNPVLKYCMEAMKHCHPCQLYTRNMWSHPSPLFLVISVGPFTKWWIDYMTCNPVSVGGHKHIIVAVDYFMKWVEAMPTFKAHEETAAFSFSTKLSHDSVSLN